MGPWVVGLTMSLGLFTAAQALAWKRRMARAYFDAGGTLPEPGKYDPSPNGPIDWYSILYPDAPHIEP